MAIEPEIFEDQEEREFDIGEPDEVEVEIEQPAVADEDPAEPEAPKAEEDAPAEGSEEPAKPRFRADKRVAAALKAKAEAEQRAADAERRAAEAERRAADGNAAQFRSMEASLKAEIDATKRALADAHTLGDYTAIADATAKLSELSADLSTVKAYTVQQTPREQQRDEQQPPREQQQQVRVDPRTQSWVQSNTWFSPSNEDYDEELAAEAQHFARKLEIRLKREGRVADIGNDDYFAQIDEHMAKTFPDVFEYDEPAPTRAKTPPMRADTRVAPVGRQQPLGQQPKPSTKVRLSAEEKAMAERLHANLPPEKAWAQYARFK